MTKNIDKKDYKYYTCRYDRAFKEVFIKDNDTTLLKVLLESILKVEINDITIKNNELETDNVHVKQKLVDAILYTDKGVINVEVNTVMDDYVRVRNTAYIMNVYGRYYLRGEDYNKDDNFIQINFNYNLKKDYLIRDYKIRSDDEVLVDNFVIYDLNMDKYLEFWYNKDKKEIDAYKYLIMLDLPKEELSVLSKSDKVVSNYMEKLDNINEDPRFQSYMSAEEDDRKFMNSIKHEYFDKGIEQGAKEEKIEIARKMLDDGTEISIIEKYTGLSKEEVEELK